MLIARSRVLKRIVPRCSDDDRIEEMTCTYYINKLALTKDVCIADYMRLSCDILYTYRYITWHVIPVESDGEGFDVRRSAIAAGGPVNNNYYITQSSYPGEQRRRTQLAK